MVASHDDVTRHAPAGGPSLAERDHAVLGQLAQDMDAWVSFQGLRRALGLHQQALTRVLRRLERDGLVARDNEGYQLTDEGSATLGQTRRPVIGGADIDAPIASAPLPLLQALLPPYVDAHDVSLALGRRWFGELRWYGATHAPGETTLRWVSEGITVNVIVAGAALRVEIDHDDDAATRAFAALKPLLAAIAGLYGRAPDGAGVGS